MSRAPAKSRKAAKPALRTTRKAARPARRKTRGAKRAAARPRASKATTTQRATAATARPRTSKAAPARKPVARTPAASRGGGVWAVIPARYASSRFPGKPLALLAGRPMIQHTYERTARTPSVTRVLVATDDARIIEAVRGFGGEAVLTGDAATGTDRIAEAVSLESRRHGAPGWVLNVQGDEPLVDPGDLERLVSGLLAVPGAVMGTLVHPLRDESEFRDPNVVKAVLAADGRALYFSRAPIPYPRAAPLPGNAPGWRHLGVYLYRTEFLHTFHRLPPTPLSERELLEQLRALEHGYAIHCFQARALGFGVDVPADLALAEAWIAAQHRRAEAPPA
jgi:3-deoxy-manno-octulosonate cytidylyltransferase (CMP-KDO synthetase)